MLHRLCLHRRLLLHRRNLTQALTLHRLSAGHTNCGIALHRAGVLPLILSAAVEVIALLLLKLILVAILRGGLIVVWLIVCIGLIILGQAVVILKGGIVLIPIPLRLIWLPLAELVLIILILTKLIWARLILI